MKNNQWVVQHELDNEPTYIVNTNDENQFVEFSADIPWRKRLEIARHLCVTMNTPSVAIV